MSRMDTDEWEVVDDDGFVYKRRKRKVVVPSLATLIESQEPVLSDDAQLRVKEALTRRKKMALLLAQKELYAAEIMDWENILKRQEDSPASAPIFQSPPTSDQVSVHSKDGATTNDELQILHLQVEAYEGFLEQLKGLRNYGESVCKKLEMEVEASSVPVEQDMFKEVVKFTPRSIIHALTTDPASPLPVLDLSEESLLSRLVENDGNGKYGQGTGT